MDQYVEWLIRSFGLRAYVERCNQAGGSKISSIPDLFVAVTFDKELEAALSAAYEFVGETKAQKFDEATRLKLEPLIVSTFMLDCLGEARVYAVELASTHPVTAGVEDEMPFPKVDDWIEWCLTHCDSRCTICGPYGEDVFKNTAFDTLLRRALRAETVTATR